MSVTDFAVGRWCAFLVITGLMLVTACSSPTTPSAHGEVLAAAQDQAVVITNETNAPVFTFTVGAQAAQLINWAPCVDTVRCTPIAPGGTRHEAHPAPFNGVAEHEAIVYWWHAVIGPADAVQPDSIRAITVSF